MHVFIKMENILKNLQIDLRTVVARRIKDKRAKIKIINVHIIIGKKTRKTTQENQSSQGISVSIIILFAN